MLIAFGVAPERTMLNGGGFSPWHPLSAMAGTYSAATPLMRSHTRAAQAVVKARKASGGSATISTTALKKPTGTGALPLWTCPDCGGAVTNSPRQDSVGRRHWQFWISYGDCWSRPKDARPRLGGEEAVT